MIAGATLESLRDEYELSIGALSRYRSKLGGKIAEKRAPPDRKELQKQKRRLAKRKDREEAELQQISGEVALLEGDLLLIKVNQMLAKVEKLIKAADEFLTDPDDPTKYDLGPRDTEIIVSVQEQYEKGDPPPPRVRITLAEATKQLESHGYIVHSIQSRHADPRNLLLQGAKTLEGQLKLIIDYAAELRQQRHDDITLHPEYHKLEAELMEAFRKHPDVLEDLQNVFGSG